MVAYKRKSVIALLLVNLMILFKCQMTFVRSDKVNALFCLQQLVSFSVLSYSIHFVLTNRKKLHRIFRPRMSVYIMAIYRART